MAPNRIIIDTDPGVDDILAMLLAFSAKPDELEVLMLSITFGNVDAENCLRNVVTLFHQIEKERAWRKANGRPEGFDALLAKKPLVAVGAKRPLAEQMMMADYFHGTDGLGGIHHTHPHLTPAETWRSLFKPAPSSMSEEEAGELQSVKDRHSLFTPSNKPAHEEMLKILRENEPGTVTIVAVGPLTNLATAAALEPETFLRVKEVVVMGGAVDFPGNMTPGAEFNTYADSVASARVFALTSPNPKTTMPPTAIGKDQLPPSMLGNGHLPPYPPKLSKQLTLKLFPLDITEPHLLPKALFNSHIDAVSGSPIAEWVSAFLSSTYKKMHSFDPSKDESQIGLQLHDPLTIWYALGASDERWKFTRDEDIRVETSGQWSRGACIVDRRGRVKYEGAGNLDADVAGDTGNWRDMRKGNRLQRCTQSPGFEKFAPELLRRIFGDV